MLDPDKPKGSEENAIARSYSIYDRVPTLTFGRASIDPDLRSRTPPADYSMYYTAVYAASTSCIVARDLAGDARYVLSNVDRRRTEIDGGR